MRFKVGDRVRCVSVNDVLILGKEYTITLCDIDSTVYVDDIKFGFFPHRFELVKESDSFGYKRGLYNV